MNKTRKITLLYQKAHGQSVNVTAEEQRELRKYRVSVQDGNYATIKNVSDYVSAVDRGYSLSFYDWCMNNHKMDRRRKGSSESQMLARNREMGLSAMLVGWLMWGIAIYWIFDGVFPAGSCAIAGAVVSAVLVRMNRRAVLFTLFLLPVILAVIFGN